MHTINERVTVVTRRNVLKNFTLQNVASFFKCKVFFRFESVVSEGKYVCKMITFYCTPYLTGVNMFDHIVILKNWTAALRNNTYFIRLSLNLYYPFWPL
jgi:hypothetical protein